MHKFEKRDAKSRTLVILAVVGLAAAITVGIFTAVRMIRKPAASKTIPRRASFTMNLRLKVAGTISARKKLRRS